MHYSGVRRGVFVERPNRFIAHAELDLSLIHICTGVLDSLRMI